MNGCQQSAGRPTAISRQSNRSRNHKIKKLEGVPQGEAQYRLSLGRWPFRYDILDQVGLPG